MLINYNGKYNDVSTLAHELGHTMQSYYSNNATSPIPTWPTTRSSSPKSPRPSTRALLVEHMLKDLTDDGHAWPCSASYLESVKGTVFRQTQFAEFELRDPREGRSRRSR